MVWEMGKKLNSLSEKQYWNKIYRKKRATEKNIYFLSILKYFSLWFFNYELLSICGKYIDKKNYKTIFEVWCAPWNYLIRFKNIYWLEPFGIEYTEDGVRVTRQNMNNNGVDDHNIIYGDFFDKNFLNKNKEKYDITYSLWFIEHFEDPKESIENHFNLTKKWWIVIICVPNLCYLNKVLTKKSILNIHNLSIMDIDYLSNSIKPYELLKIKYIWGLFNWWLFSYSNRVLDLFRYILFIIQRLLIDPIFIVLYKIWLDFSNKYTSPWILLICRKK